MRFIKPSCRPILVIILSVVLLGGCEENQSPEIPAAITGVSGDGQFSKKGTELPNALVAKVVYSDGTPAPGVRVDFSSVQGGGTVAPTSASTNSIGLVSTRYTLGDQSGPNTVRATIVDNNSKFTEFAATAGEFFCPEEDPTFVRKFAAQGDLFLFTRKSSVHQSGSETIAGVIRIVTDFIGGTAVTSSFVRIDETVDRVVVQDAAFSPAGDFFLALSKGEIEILKVNGDRSTQPWIPLESFFLSEITYTPNGILAGCDRYGPFAVGCRAPLIRYTEAQFTGAVDDRASNDAVAVDPNTEDIYFIYLPDSTLRRLPIDTLVATGPTEIAANLTREEANGANGMLCDDDGTVYILVDTDNTKKIVSVTSAGAKSDLIDFVAVRGAGAAAGIQRDLALRRGIRFLYTLDTGNDVLLVYNIPGSELNVLQPPAGDPDALSTSSSPGERVGLVVLP